MPRARRPAARARSNGFARRIAPIACLGLIATASACAMVPASVAGFRNTTVPVLVGPVERIGGKRLAPESSVAEFRIKATNLYRFNSSPGGGGTIHRQTEDEGKFDVEVEKALESCKACRVRVEQVLAGSHSAVLIGVSDDTHWTGTEVGLYPSQDAPKGRSEQ